jgi:hypothetical protein
MEREHLEELGGTTGILEVQAGLETRRENWGIALKKRGGIQGIALEGMEKSSLMTHI